MLRKHKDKRFIRRFVGCLSDDQVLTVLTKLAKKPLEVGQFPLEPAKLKPEGRRKCLIKVWEDNPESDPIIKHFADSSCVSSVRGMSVQDLKRQADQLISQYGLSTFVAALVSSTDTDKADFGLNLLQERAHEPVIDTAAPQVEDPPDEQMTVISDTEVTTAQFTSTEPPPIPIDLASAPSTLHLLAEMLHGTCEELNITELDNALIALNEAWQRYKEQRVQKTNLQNQINTLLQEIYINYAVALKFFGLTENPALVPATYHILNQDSLTRAVELLQSLAAVLAPVPALLEQRGESWEQDQRIFIQLGHINDSIKACMQDLIAISHLDVSPESISQPSDVDIADTGSATTSSTAQPELEIESDSDSQPEQRAVSESAAAIEPEDGMQEQTAVMLESTAPVLEDLHSGQDTPVGDGQPIAHEDSMSFSLETTEPSEPAPRPDEYIPDQPPELKSVVAVATNLSEPESSCSDSSHPPFLNLVWRLLEDDRCGLAYVMAQEMEKRYPDELYKLSPWLVRAVALGRHVYGSNSQLAQLIQEDFHLYSDSCFIEHDREWNYAVRFLILAGAMQPALVAPSTNATLLLDGLKLRDGLGELSQFVQTIVEFASRRYPLNAADLRSVRDLSAWNEQCVQLKLEVDNWWERASELNFSYPTARYVWRQWLEPDGVLCKLIAPIRRNDEQRLDEVKSLLQSLVDDTYIKEQAEYALQQINGSGRGLTIHSNAFAQVKRRAREAAALAERWVNLHAMQPSGSRDNIHQIIDTYRQRLTMQLPSVFAELERFDTRHAESCAVRAGIACCRRVLRSIQELFDPEQEFNETEPEARHLLFAELLCIEGLELDEDWSPKAADHLLEQLVALAEQSEWDWREIFDHCCRRKDHLTSQRIIELAAAGVIDIACDELITLRLGELEKCRRLLEKDIQFTRNQVESALTSGLLSEADYQQHKAVLEQLENERAAIVTFEKHHAALAEIRTAIEHSKAERVEAVRKRLHESSISKDNPYLVQVEKALENGDILTANEYIDLLERGEAISTPTEEQHVFDDFFPRGVQQIETYLSNVRPKALVDNIRKRKKQALAVIDILKPGTGQTNKAAECIKTWYEAKERRGEVSDKAIWQIMEHLGFTVMSIDVKPSRGRIWVDVRTAPIMDRDQCPLPAYGSGAKGHYRVLCLWDRPPEEELVMSVDDTNQSAPAIVLYFGRMSDMRRRILARFCWEKRRTLLVVDEILMYYLCGVAGARLPVFFACTLPFTFLEPYSITSSLVEPEMFYGRQRAREEIIKPDGTCFIYGGRQLGKTALLRDVERNFHQPDGLHRAVWIDLKVRGIGRDRSLDDIWVILAEELKRIGVLPATLSENARVQMIIDQVYAWLSEDQERRVLLLLDEADLFLESDAREGYMRTDKLKGLMDRTERRFKVVFAGLHNVQRIAREENHPFGHFGESICIGPLLEGGEWREARDLVVRPLESLGFVFENQDDTGIDLVTRILSQTNYYPSLIQVYCRYLLLYMHSPRRMQRLRNRSGPPYVITANDLDEVYTSQDMCGIIRQRFMLTLQLDDRYDMLAHLIGYYSLEQKDQIGEGFSVSWIRQQALALWEDGFRVPEGQSSDEYFRILLDEMVGLGVLRSTPDGKYALRNANVLLLMGTQDDILTRLYRHREAPLAYEPQTFRRVVRRTKTHNEPYVRSPLTVYQDNLLQRQSNGIFIVIGCKAGGLEQIEDYLRSSFETDAVRVLTDAIEHTHFVDALGRVINSRRKNERGNSVVLVPATCPWSEVWVKEAQRVRGLRSPRSFVQVVFLADPDTAWRLAGDESEQQIYAKEGVQLIHLQPWHEAMLRQVLDDCNIGPQDEEMRKSIREVTGLWPELVVHYFEQVKDNPVAWQEPLTRLKDQMTDKQFAQQWAEYFGLQHPERFSVLALLHELEEATLEDIYEFAENIPANRVDHVLHWARLLNFAGPGREDRWRCNPAVGRLAQCLKEAGR